MITPNLTVSFMLDSSPHSGSNSGSADESLVERAVRLSLPIETNTNHVFEGEFSREDHLAIARSGSADLSTQEKKEVLRDLPHIPTASYPSGSPRPIPLFFGSWSGMNPFRFMKPFHVRKKRS